MKKKTLIYDFDGVLGDTFEMNWAITRKLHPEVSQESYRIDHHLGNVFERPVVPFTKETGEEYWRRYNRELSVEHVHASLPTLHTLAPRFRFHVVTSNCEVAIERVLRDAGVREYFGFILGRQAHASKEEKFKLLSLTERFGLHDALFVTDTLGDLNEAEKVNLPSIGVTFGYHPREILLKGKSQAIVDTHDELAKFALSL